MDFQVNWASFLILSRHRVLVATSVILVLVAEASAWLRHIFGGADVATAWSCRDLFSLYLMSRQLADVATFESMQWMSRQLYTVATSSLRN